MQRRDSKVACAGAFDVEIVTAKLYTRKVVGNVDEKSEDRYYALLRLATQQKSQFGATRRNTPEKMTMMKLVGYLRYWKPKNDNK